MEIKKENLRLYIEEMSHFDPDNMEMGARAVSELVISGLLNLQQNQDIANTIRQAFIKQMESENNEVHAHAIKCVAEMISKLPISQVLSIFQKTIRSITDKNLDEKKRDIYRGLADTMIHKANEQFGPMLSHLFVDSITALLYTNDSKLEIQIILIKVISEFISRWPNVASDKNTNYKRVDLIKYLLNNIQKRHNYYLANQSQAALGKLSLILDLDHLNIALKDPLLGLIPFIVSNIGKFQFNYLKSLREGVICLEYVIKTQNAQLKHFALQISELMIQIINCYKPYKPNKQTNQIQIDINCQILQAAIICQTIILRSFPKELSSKLTSHKNPLNDFVGELINYNAEQAMKYIDVQQNIMSQQYEGEDDYYDHQQIEEKHSWKVRKAIIQYVTVLMRKDQMFRQDVVNSQEFLTTLGYKLIQENPMITQAAIQALNSLIEAITTEKNQIKEQDIEQIGLMRIKSSEVDLAHMILTEIEKRTHIIYRSSKFTDQMKTSVSKLVLRLVNAFKAYLKDHQKLTLSLLNEVEYLILNSKIQTKFNELIILRQLIFQFFQFQSYKNSLSIFIKGSSSQNYKVCSISLKGIRKIMLEFPSEMIKHEMFNQIIQIIIKKLKQQDADRVVKNSVILCVGSLFAKYFQRLNQYTQNQLLQGLEYKLKIQIQKSSILNQLTYLDPKYSVKPSQVIIFTRLIEKTLQSLGNVNFQLNSQAIQSTKRLIEILKHELQQKTVGQILTKTKPLFSDQKIPSYINLLIDRFPGQFNQYVEPIIKTADTDLIIKLIDLKITDVNTALKILQSNSKPQKAKNISIIVGKMRISDEQLIKQIDNHSLWGQICLGALGYVGTPKNVKFLFQVINEGNNQDLKFEACNSLGNIGSRHQSQIVPIVIQQCDKTEDCYIYIYILRQLINYSKTSFQQIQKLAHWLLAKSQGNLEGQSIYSMIAECLGKIFIISNQILKSILKEAQKMSDNKRLIIAHSLRFALEGKQNSLITEAQEDYIKLITKLAGDPIVDVRHGAMKSLSTIISNHFITIKHNIHEDFWGIIKKNLKIHEELIIEVDYGISKEQKDTGKPTRLQSFNFLKVAISKLSIDGHIQQLMQICLDKINKQTSTDLIIKRLNIIKILCQKDFALFVSLQNQFIAKLGVQEGILKGFQVQKEGGDQRAEAYLRTLLKQIQQISVIAMKQSSDIIRSFIGQLKTVHRFSLIFDSIQKI